MQKYLGIDYGDTRIGVAVSDDGGTFAFPKNVIDARVHAIVELKKTIEKEKIETVVIGLPQNFDGKDTEQTKKVRAFAEAIKKECTVNIVFQNEILTSAQVDKSGGSTTAMHDASAAALILQSFLDNR